MQIGILGTGSVGQALATGFESAGHDVVLGSRDPEAVGIEMAEVRRNRAAAAGADVVVLAVPASAAIDMAERLADTLAEKPVVDATNEYPTATSHDPIAVRVADAAPAAAVVKGFNTIGANRMTEPVIAGQPATMFLAGDADAAVETVAGLAADLGFDPVVAGDLQAATHVEGLARFWIHLSQTHGRDVGFRFLGAD